MAQSRRRSVRQIIRAYGKDILESEGMQKEKRFCQHGTVSVYEHSLSVAERCVRIAQVLPIRTDMRSLVRGALLHDYFLYDWHIPDKSHRFHGFRHPATAYRNARRDFRINCIEENMIRSHMFPMVLPVPRYRESVILCLADKICATQETMQGFFKHLQ